MGAGVAQGIEATLHTNQGNLLALHPDQFGLLVCQLVGRARLSVGEGPLAAPLLAGRIRRGVAIRIAEPEEVMVRGVMAVAVVTVLGAPALGHRRAGGEAGTRSREGEATGSAKSCAIPPEGHV